jgi:hypothetical protein
MSAKDSTARTMRRSHFRRRMNRLKWFTPRYILRLRRFRRGGGLLGPPWSQRTLNGRRVGSGEEVEFARSKETRKIIYPWKRLRKGQRGRGNPRGCEAATYGGCVARGRGWAAAGSNRSIWRKSLGSLATVSQARVNLADAPRIAMRIRIGLTQWCPSTLVPCSRLHSIFERFVAKLLCHTGCTLPVYS